MNQGMEFEGSCPQDAVGLVVLKGISLSASTRENQSSFVLSLTSKSSELGCLSLSTSTRENHSSFGLSFTSKSSELGCMDIVVLNMELKQVFVLTDTVHALIRTFFVARLMAAVLEDIYPAIIP
ncbi:hypothetical protein POTOM_042617 [Populus tomentosa]|uniref:Uncharacterized protein n=1 Tax=Populus tomentosa TaxID=118781 RepID=A0A8X7YQ83_POPTO|nr:hypothetical protein POTOM_042617 [Populus tomentosa]